MSSPLFSVDISHVDGRNAVRFIGELDMEAANTAKDRALDALSAFGDGPLFIDLSDLSFCDSSGLHALTLVAQTARSDGRLVVLVRPRQAVRQVLRIAGLDSEFVIEDEDWDSASSP